MSAITQEFHGRTTELHLPATKGAAVSASTLVAYVDDMGTLDLSRSMVDLLAYQDDDVRRLAGAKDAGTISFTLHFVPGDTDHAALVNAYDNGTSTPVTIKWVDGANTCLADFEGFVSKLAINSPKEDKVTAEVEITISGSVDFTLAPA